MNASSRRRTRLILRDLAGAAAFSSMAASGELPIWGVAVFGIACVLALLGKRILARHGTASAIGLLVGAAGLYLSVAAGGFDLVIAASTFAGLITAQRMLSDPSPGTDNQVHLTSLLMISGGAALSGDLLFGLCLAIFAVCIALSLGLGVVDSASKAQDELPVRPALRQIAIGSIFAVIGGVVFFVAFPRLNWNVAARHMPRGLGAEAGLSETIRLGATGGSIKTTARVVARVKLTPDPGKNELDRYFVASRLTEFDGRGWDGPKNAQQYQGVNLFPEVKDVVQQQYELLPGYGAPIAVAMSPPVGFFNAMALHAGTAASRVPFSVVRGREVRFAGVGNGYSYSAWSAKGDGPITVPKPEREAAMQLPEKLDPRVAPLAKQIVGNEKNPERAAEKLIAYLQKNYSYTLELPGPVDDPLANFLFERKKGHCEYFATALTVMLRTVGIPARVAVGFYGGTRNGDHYILRAGDAHAWTEVLTDHGFVTVDATPEAGRKAQSSSFLSWATDTYEQVESWWSRSIVDYSLRDQFLYAQKLLDSRPMEVARKLKLPNAGRLLATAITGILAYLIVRLLARGRGSSGSKHEATALFEAMAKALHKAGVDVDEADDVSELAKKLKVASHPMAADFERVSVRYLAARFGKAPLRDGELDHLVKVLERASAMPVSSAR